MNTNEWREECSYIAEQTEPFVREGMEFTK
jgi:hypothetical protein